MKTFACNGEWRGRKITASVLVLDQGIRVDLYGGDLPHIGAVSAVSCDKRLETILFPGHREAVLSESWAASLNRQTGMPVAVTAGIHYDGVTWEDIEEIVKVTEEMRKQVMEKISLL